MSTDYFQRTVNTQSETREWIEMNPRPAPPVIWEPDNVDDDIFKDDDVSEGDSERRVKEPGEPENNEEGQAAPEQRKLRGRPQIVRTGRPGRPREQYSMKNSGSA